MGEKDAKHSDSKAPSERATMPRHGGNIEAIRDDYYDAEEMGVKGERDIRAVGINRDPEPDRGKEFSGPGRRRDPDDAHGRG